MVKTNESMIQPISKHPYENNNQPRQRLRAWLTKQLDLANCPGCEWIDEKEQVFKLTWKHYGRPGFDQEKDAKMFREWAQHTKRWTPGEPPDVSTWKTRFRNALHKMPDIEELNTLHELDGNEPYRVYRFRTVAELERIREAQKSCSMITNGQASLTYDVNSPMASIRSPMPNTNMPGAMPQLLPPKERHSPTMHNEMMPQIGNMMHHNAMQVSTVPNTVSDFHASMPRLSYSPMCPPTTLIASEDIKTECSFELNYAPKIDAIKQFLKTPEEPMNSAVGVCESNGKFDDEDFSDLNAILKSMVADGNAVEEKLDFNEESCTFSETALAISLNFSETAARPQVVTKNSPSVRIAYKAPPPVPLDLAKEEVEVVLANIYGPLDAQQIYYPYGSDANTQRILNWIRRGLVLEVTDRGDIYATRLCQAKVFYAESENIAPKGLVRSQKTRVFSFLDQFLPQLNSYKCLQSDIVPSYEVLFSFGQEWSRHAKFKEMLINCNVTHLLSKKLVKELQAQNYVNVQVSVQNDHDLLKEDFENLAISKGQPYA